MRCNLARRELATVLVALALAMHAGAAQAVKLAISSAQVSQPGAATQLCVSLSTDGQEVAGTQNDLVWDGTCMTLNEGACAAAGGHGKQVNTRIQNSNDFRMRVLVLSLSDVDPIDDGILYCCAVQGEAPAGSCCSISVVNTGASDSKGNAVAGVGGNSGRLCTGGSSGGGAVGSINPPGSQMGQNLGDNGGGSMGDSGGAMAGGGSGGSGAQAPPANQVLPGGGAPAAPAAPANPAAAPVLPVPGAPGAQAPTPAGAPTVNLPPAYAVPVTPVAAVPPATAAATVAVAAPTAAAPTIAPTAAVAPPTAVPPTKAPPSTPTAPRVTATAKSGGGWFGCQIDAHASAAPALALALLLAALARVARRSHR